MVVCCCKGVTESTIRRAIAEGATSVTAVGAACGAGTDCGACVRDVEAMVRATPRDRSGLLDVLRRRTLDEPAGTGDSAVGRAA